MRDPNGLGLADLSDRPSLIGVCANPRMTEAVAGEIVRKAGAAAATRLRDNESLPEEFRRGLAALEKSEKFALRGYDHILGGRIFITLFPAHAGVIPRACLSTRPACRSSPRMRG